MLSVAKIECAVEVATTKRLLPFVKNLKDRHSIKERSSNEEMLLAFYFKIGSTAHMLMVGVLASFLQDDTNHPGLDWQPCKKI